MKKGIGIGVALAVLAASAGAVYYFASNLNALVASAIETHGSEVTDTRVSVSGVDISVREGRASIAGLRVESPAEFTARDAFSLGDITVDIDVKSVREDPVVIDEVRIQAPVIHAEVTKTGSTNIDELRKRVQAYTVGSGVTSGGSSDKRAASKNIRIKSFVFEQGRVEVDATALGVDKRTLDLPEIRLVNVGGANGVPPDELVKIILTAVAKKVGSEIAHSEVDRLIKAQLGDESLTDKAKGLLGKLVD